MGPQVLFVTRDGLTALAHNFRWIHRVCVFPLAGTSQSCHYGAAVVLSVPEAAWSNPAVHTHGKINVLVIMAVSQVMGSTFSF